MILEHPNPWQAANQCVGDVDNRIKLFKNENDEEDRAFFKGFMEGLLRKNGLDIEAYRILSETTFGKRQWFAIGVLEGASGRW